MYKCWTCGNEFIESDADIHEYGSGAVLSKVELFACPECDSENLYDIENNKFQK